MTNLKETLTLKLKSDMAVKSRDTLPIVKLTRKSLADFEMLGNSAFHPLKGFMGSEDYRSVLNDMRLSDGPVWSIPITLPIDKDQKQVIGKSEEVLLSNENGDGVGKIFVSDIFSYDKKGEAEKVYLTSDEAHPGVNSLFSQGAHYVAGEIEAYSINGNSVFSEYRHSPNQLRALFKELGWKKVVGFQTRNPIHRAHEYITKCALEMVDGLLIHPLVGQTKKDDIPADVRMECYKVLLDNYYPHTRTRLSVFPAYMRYAGPREAVFHAIVRRNYGCTHFIVGRDHAGVGNYYGTYDAQKIFDNFTVDELGIEPMFFEHAFYCKRTNSMATTKTSRAMDHEKVFFSGSKVREILSTGGELPEEFTRSEVEKILRRHYDNKK
tara:strand:- start:5015 stop:6154 length:1140 start_codon:yes stop_codon:yes gene_type:complete